MFPNLIEKLTRHENLTSDEAAAAMAEVMEGRATPAQIAGLLIGLAMKGERPAEIVGLARTMRAHAVQVSRRYDRRVRHLRHRRRPLGHVQHLVVRRAGRRRLRRAASPSTATARRRAARAAPTCSRRSASASRRRRPSSSAASPRRASASSSRRRSTPRCGTPAPARKEHRRAHGVQPARPADQSGGRDAAAGRRAAAEFTELMARALMLLGSERAWVVHGADGIDEISTTGYTKISECRDGAVNTFYLHPADVGLPKATLGARSRAATAHDNARHHRGDPRRRARARARRRAAERGRGAVRRRRGGVGRGRASCTPRARSTAATPRARSSGSSRSRPPASSCRGSARDGGTRRRTRRSARHDRRRDAAHRRGARGAPSRSRRWRGAPTAVAARAGPRSARRSPRTDRVNVIAECKRRSPSRGVLRREYDPVAIARELRGGRRGGDLGADRADLLRRLARAPGGGPGRGRRAAAAQGLHRLAISAARGAGGGRGRRAADRRGARRRRSSQALHGAGASGWASTRSSKCTTTTSSRAPSTPARAIVGVNNRNLRTLDGRRRTRRSG